MPSLDVISVNIWHVLISLINLLLMFLILKHFLFKPVKNMIAQRRAQVDQVYAEANADRDDAKAMKQEYEARMSTAREEADNIVKQAADTARRKSDEMVNEAALQASHLRQKAEAEIAREKKQMLDDVKSEISGIAVSIATKVMEREINEKDCDRYVDEFIKNVGDAK